MKRTGIRIICILLLLLGTKQMFALQAVMSHNIFFAPEGKQLSPYVEIYWEIDPRSLLFDKKDELLKAKIQTDIIIKKGNDTYTEEHYILETPPFEDAKQVLNQRIIDLRRLGLDTGIYHLEVTLTDLIKKGGVFSYKKEIKIELHENSFLSDIQLIDTLLPSSGGQNIFQRNGYLQLPVFTNFIDENNLTIRYYAELYNSFHSTADGGIVYISKKEDGIPIYGLIDSFSIEHSLLEIIQGKMNINVLPSGNYYLNISENNTNAKKAQQSYFFQVMNPHPKEYVPITTKDTSEDSKNTKATVVDLNNTFLSKYNPGQIRAILKMLMPIAQPAERLQINEFLNAYNDMYARYFIVNFWTKRNATAPDEAWNQYADKVRKVNREFGTGTVRGYESERGKMYLQYGPPTQRIRVNNEDGAIPYEIWQYEVLNNTVNALLLFYQPGFLGSDYILLHSTLPGERKNIKWRQSLYRNGMPNSTNSRADQFFGNL